jgi:cytoskeletal protein RodZ
MTDIGETLRDARMRGHIDVSEIEARTKIRAKYLRALENEEWGLLPGPTFVKSFLRTYAQALGLDGKALVEEYRLSHESQSEALLEPIVSSPHGARGRAPAGGRSPASASRVFVALVGVVLLLIVLLVVGLITGGGSSKSGNATTAASTHKHGTGSRHQAARPAGAASLSADVALSLHTTAVVNVCLIGDNGRKLIGGIDLAAGTITPTYRAKRFQITLGNNAVTLFVDGRARSVPASNQAIGYSITKATGRRRLSAEQLPTCK